MLPTIRPARISDVPALNSFQQQLIHFERPFSPTIKPRGKIEYYKPASFIRSSLARLLVAEIDGKIIGCGYARIISNPKWMAHKKQGYLGFMFVSKKFRGNGIAGMILRELLAWLKQKNIRDIRLEVYAKNAGAVAAYKKYGFFEHVLEMRLK